MPFDGTRFKQQDTVLDLLRRARVRIARPGGWCQGDYWVGDGVCIFGALNAVIAVENNLALSVVQAADVLVSALGSPDLDSYNDDPKRTQEDVVALFDRAIALRLDAIVAE